MPARAKPIKIRSSGVAVSLYRQARPGRKMRWLLADYSAGKRKLRSFTDEAEARAEARRVAGRLAAGDREGAAMTGGERARLRRAEALLEPAGAPLEVACARYAEGVKVLGGDFVVEAARFYARHHRLGTPAKPLGEAATELLLDVARRGKSGRYVSDLSSRLGRMQADLGPDTAVRDLDTPRLQTWLDGLPLAPRSRENFRRIASVLFSYCRHRGWCASNPAADVSRETVRPKDREPVTPEELRRLLASSTPDVLPVLVLGHFLGLRSSEIGRLQWADVDLARGHLAVRAKSKTGRRTVPLHDPVRAWLAPCTGRTGPVWPGEGDFYRELAQTAARAGLTWKSNQMRVSAASYLVALHGAAQTAEWLGHDVGVLRRVYRELVLPDAARAWFAIAPDAPANVLALGRAA